jgi:VIT1/CCC1 family predicted Fe2+/Mn2+ transporter
MEEHHRIHRVGWLRAAVLGANDGIVSIGSLVVGVSAGDPGSVALAGMAGLVGGALSMAAGEYVSVASQRDTEEADIALEAKALQESPKVELREMAEIWQQRGLDADLSMRVAEQLHAHDALQAHLRDELGITDDQRARPWLAAGTSATAFSVGAALPVGVGLMTTSPIPVFGACLAALALSGVLSARAGGAEVGRATARIVLGGALAMGVTYALGAWFGVAV